MNIPSRDGFTLMEAVVSIAIVSIGFVAIYSVFVVAEKSQLGVGIFPIELGTFVPS